ncbi:proton myo-inositol cotransporter-like isoform X1 [Anguilla anguilla]|uniref:proton myo-inositol cotransporter-like isoform X1 n=2 Tax=Anguilla anguilla TaxID=7936 RepID=UPI0015B0DE6E|nr:proton myo-inositol cotransporter-like isoform X1 [Anguilla anguilla]
MSRKSSDNDYTLRSMSNLMGERRKKVRDDGERSLIKAPSNASINSQGPAAASTSAGDLERAARKQFQQDVTPAFVYVLAAFSALGGFLFGYDTGVVSGAMLLLKREMNLSALWQELLVSSTVGAAALSALAGGFLNGIFGRRVCILLASFIFSTGGVVLSTAPNKEVLLVGRIIVGLGLGIASMTVPVYIAESSPPQLRGQLVTLNTLFITGGQFVASLVDGAFCYVRRGGWRYMLGLSVVPAALQFVGFLFLPESPRWLIQRGLTQKARRVLSQIRGNQNIDEEYDSIKSSIEEEEKDCGGGGPVIWRMLSYPPTRRALIVGCGLQMFQQLSGINTVMYYSATILQMSGVRDDKQAIWLSAVTAFTNFLFTLLGVWLVERTGRRRLTLGSIIGTALSLSLLAVGFLLSAQHTPPVTLRPAPPPAPPNSTCARYGSCEPCMLDPACGFCYRENGSSVFDTSCVPANQGFTGEAAWGRCSNSSQAGDGTFWAYNYCPTSYSWVVLLGLMLYLAFFAPGMGPMPWTVNSEIYPLWARSTGNACSAGVNWTFNVLVSLTFLHVAQFLTYYGAFFLYSGLALLGSAFVFGCLPETKSRRLEEMEALFEGGLCTCGATDSDEGRQIEYIRVKGSNYHLSDNDASDVE